MSDRPHWWPAGGSEGSADGGDPYRGYYYPPGTTPGARRGGGPAPTRPRPTVSPRRWLWGAVAIAIVLVLVRSNRITRDDVILFCVIVPSIILHEIAHGWVALAFGDDTAKRAGRLTLNPMAHVDIIGTVIVPILMILGGYGWFGWAKPVPVNVARLRSPRNHGVLVSLAGPATNVVLCVVSAVAFHLFGGIHAVDANGQLSLWALILVYLGLVNVWLAAINLVPIPPLDGSVLVERLLPSSWWPRYLELRRYTFPLVLVAVVLAQIIHSGNTTLLGHLSRSTENWWLGVLGIH